MTPTKARLLRIRSIVPCVTPCLCEMGAAVPPVPPAAALDDERKIFRPVRNGNDRFLRKERVIGGKLPAGDRKRTVQYARRTSMSRTANFRRGRKLSRARY